MPCIFCRSNNHTKINCSHPITRVKEQEINSFIQSTYSASQRHALTREEFNVCIKMVLSDKFTVLQLKMSIEDFKRKLHSTNSGEGNKHQLILYLTDIACMFYNYTFAPLSRGHLLNPYQLTTGIRAVTSEILHPQVRNLNTRVENERYTTPAPAPAPAPAPVPPSRVHLMVTEPLDHGTRERMISNINHINRLYNTVLGEQQANWPHRVNNIHVPAYMPPISQQHPPTAPQYTIHKTDKKCDDSTECAVCFNGLNNETYVYLKCSHEFCKTCIKECLTRNLRKCPLCRAPITDVYTQNPNVSYSI